MKDRITIEEVELEILHHREFPAAPTLIFLHDALGSLSTWGDFPQALASVCQCNLLVYSRQGHGQSAILPPEVQPGKGHLEREAEVLGRLLDQLEIERPILYGHSDGGSIALILAAQRQDLLGIVSLAAHTFVEPITRTGVQQTRNSYRDSGLQKSLHRHHGSKGDQVFSHWVETWLGANFRDWDIRPLLLQITCPCLVIQGTADEYGTEAQVDNIRQRVQGPVETHLLSNIGHLPHREDRSATLKLSRHFIEQLT